LGSRTNNNLELLKLNHVANYYNKNNNVNILKNKTNKNNHLNRNRASITTGYEKLSMSFTKDSYSLNLFSENVEAIQLKEKTNKLV
jgi:hypothetical protein